VISLSPVVEGLKRVEKGVDKTASELAIARLTQEINQIERAIDNQRAERFESNFKRAAFAGPSGCVVLGSLWAIVAGAELFAGFGGLILGGALLIFAFRGFFVKSISTEENQLANLLAEKCTELAKHQQIVKF